MDNKVAMLVSPAGKLIYYWLAVIFCGIFIFSISSIPGKDIPSLFPYQDIAFHALIYGVFAFSISGLIKIYNPKKIKFIRILLVLGLIFLFALTDEFHQLFVTNRSASLLDVGIDCVGAAIGAFFHL